MSPATSETQTVPARPAFSTGTLIAVGVWACVFAAFVVLGLQS